MDKKTQALKLALEALDGWRKGFPDHWGDIDECAIDAIREALAEQPAQPYPDNFIDALKYDVAKRDSEAQPEQEPVAIYRAGQAPNENYHVQFFKHMTADEVLLYTTPPHRKPLTDEAIWSLYKNLWMFHPAEEPRLAGDILKFARAIEAKLREKNA